MYGTWPLSASPDMLPMSRLCRYLPYLGPISLPRYAPKVAVMLLFTVLGPHQPPHRCSQSRGYAAIDGTLALTAFPDMLPMSRSCCYLRCLGPISFPKYAPNVELQGSWGSRTMRETMRGLCAEGFRRWELAGWLLAGCWLAANLVANCWLAGCPACYWLAADWLLAAARFQSAQKRRMTLGIKKRPAKAD